MIGSLRHVWRYVWPLPNTLLGGLLGGLGCLGGGRVQIVAGVLEVHGRWLECILQRATPLPGGVAAITFGHVILGRDALTLARVRSHERVHVAQYERWGPLFLPAYLAASAWAWARRGDAYRDNPFEREARRLSGELD